MIDAIQNAFTGAPYTEHAATFIWAIGFFMGLSAGSLASWVLRYRG